ncbi:PREDICTED: uncharacterized protein K02A2.6-like, partial [Vollenhovia emeryi]|uniref:uncharacterized protein K02A2.6-like n=1 Tax=Vollenhovia emeryi TaxID=411798 RepID=UPI0005F51CB5
KCTLQSWPVATRPWSRIHADYAVSVEGFNFLVIVDAYSKWPEIFKTTATTSSRTIELFSEAFARNGLPDTLITDNGVQFTSDEFKNFCAHSGIEHIRSAPYHPQSNGQAEKFVHLLKTGLERAQGNVDQKLREFLTCYRRTPSYSLGGKSPSELMNGRPMKTRLDLCKSKPSPSQQRDEQMEARFNISHGAKWKEFTVGSPVYYKRNRSNIDWEWIPATILSRSGAVNYAIESEAGKVFPNVHANQLKSRKTKNEFLEAFDLTDVTDTEVEPFITLQAEAHEQNQEDENQDLETTEEIFEDAEDFQEVEQPAPLRRTTRVNAGIPPARFGGKD